MENEKEFTLDDIKSLEQWALITIQRWETKISKMDAYKAGDLLKSFTHQIINDSAGNPAKILFTFEYYGRFVDMGVGKGVPLGKVNMSNRVAKPWYARTLVAECNFLAKLFAARYGKIAAKSFKIIENQSYPDNNNNRRVYGF